MSTHSPPTSPTPSLIPILPIATTVSRTIQPPPGRLPSAIWASPILNIPKNVIQSDTRPSHPPTLRFASYSPVTHPRLRVDTFCNMVTIALVESHLRHLVPVRRQRFRARAGDHGVHGG